MSGFEGRPGHSELLKASQTVEKRGKESLSYEDQIALLSLLRKMEATEPEPLPQTDMDVASKLVSVLAGSSAGAALGSGMGTAIGALIGSSLLPGVGTLAGAAIGALAGKIWGIKKASLREGSD